MEVPDWKVHLLERRRKEEEEMKRKEREEEERLSKMPAWKREIILRRKAKASAPLSGSREEIDEGEREEKEKVDIGDHEEREIRVSTEKIGPVQQNPFIQLEKQRRIPEPSFARSEPSYTKHEPSFPRPEPSFARQDPLLARSEPLLTRPEPSFDRQEPLLTRPEPSLTQPEPSLTRPEPMLTRAEPSLDRPESSLARPESSLARPESSWAKPEPSLARPESSLARQKPSPEKNVLRTSRAEEVVIDPKPPSEEDPPEVSTENRLPMAEERRGRVSRLLSRFGRSWMEGENGVLRMNGEEDVSTQALQPATVMVEPELHTSTSLVQTSPPPPPPPPSSSCPRIATGSYNSTQETILSSPPSSSCSDSEPSVLSASVAMSGLGTTRPSLAEEARPFPFNLRPASPAAPRQPKITAQATLASARPEAFIQGTLKTEEDGEGRQGLNRLTCPTQGIQNRGTGDSPAMHRRKGNTITVNPRKMAVCENGFVATETKAPTTKTETGKKRYPTADEIKVIGGYQALAKSCLAKRSRDKKKMNISFPESELECTFEYPSESSILSEFGPLDEPEVPVPVAQPEEDEEEESVLLGGLMRRKALIVDESCKR